METPVFEETDKQVLRDMHRRKVQEVMRRKACAQNKRAWLRNLRKMLPVFFMMILSWSCCLLPDPNLNVAWLYRDSLRFATLSQQDRNNEILSSMTWNRASGSFHGQMLNSWPTCDTCFRNMRGISEATWNRRRKQARERKKHWEHGSCGSGKQYTEKGFLTRAWMSDFFTTLGDFQPDSGQIHLPPMDQQDVYNECKQELDEKCVSPSHFGHIWHREFNDVVIPEKQRLGKCEQCEDFHEQIISSRDPREREAIKQRRVQHIKFVRRERLVYHRWRKRCKDEPEKYMCVILDGMDQNKTNLPSFNTGESPDGITVRIIGGLIHSAQKTAHAYLVTHFTKETNTMIEVLRRVLESRDTLPPTLVLQLDNTSQENKNSHFFAYLSALVHAGTFERIVVNFLPVGHTHEDIDQMFSRFSKELKGVSARSMEELTASLKRAVQGVHVEHITRVCDFWSFIKPFTVPYSLHLYYAFEIAKNDDNKVALRYKTTMAGEVWLPCGRFKDDRSFAPLMLTTNRVPVPSFSFVVPGVLPVITLRSMVSAYEHRLVRQRSSIRFADEVPGACVQWWRSFLDTEETRIANMCSTCVEIRSELATIVVRRAKGMTVERKAVNSAKQRRKEALLAELQTHDCIDTHKGSRDVPPEYSSLLADILRSFSSADVQHSQQEEKKQKEIDILPGNPAQGFSDSESDVEGYSENTDGLTILRSGQSKPVAYVRRGNRIKKGMFIATMPDPSDEHMGEHPFWIQKVIRITRRRVKVHYYGPSFLGVYKPLVNVDDNGADYVDVFQRTDFTTLHWNISLVGGFKSHDGGRLSAPDRRYLSLDVRVPWTDTKSSSSGSNSRPSDSSRSSKRPASSQAASRQKRQKKR